MRTAMTSSPWRATLFGALLLSGCLAVEPSDRAIFAESEAPTLVALQATGDAPPASDAAPRWRVAFAMPDGSLREVDREATAFVPRWRDGAALVDPEGRLYEVRPDGDRRMLARGAVGPLAVSSDGALLAYAVVRGAFGDLYVHDGAQPRRVAEGLASAGVVRVDEGGVLFVGGRPGGVAGEWLAPLDGSGARCLTNCELETGTDWTARFEPPTSAGEQGGET